MREESEKELEYKKAPASDDIKTTDSSAQQDTPILFMIHLVDITESKPILILT